MSQLEAGLARLKPFYETSVKPVLEGAKPFYEQKVKPALAKAKPFYDAQLKPLITKGEVPFYQTSVKPALDAAVARYVAWVGTPGDPKRVGIAIAAVIFLVAFLGSVVTRASVDTWYNDLNHPFFTPPNAAFGPAWSVMFILMGVAAWRVWRALGWPAAKAPFTLWGIQLGLNVLWSVLFFGFQSMGLALVESFIFVAVAALAARAFLAVDKTAGYLMIPVAIWTVFASLLNLGMIVVN
ncbi:TspO/MBR family protein [Pararhodospirillum photometricum]|uniref:TspO and MBR related proteins n=1 Tax=Pararhodospirillum photometricum DSM 122 TaxID=1150469 RepID=H6SJE1_PARPM|nr:TspO/MBR family protein [Pararhodospirillum photometricum]CCG08106.1 TspO and MBR related proteins [Pararhodospirillum photometricum DSM 122]